MRRVLPMLVLLAGCRTPRAPTPSGAGAPRAGAEIAYDVRVSPDLSTLSVRARVERGGLGRLGLDDETAPFVRGLTVDGTLAERRDGSFGAAACLGPCEITYDYALGDAARALASVETAFSRHGVVVAPPSTWLLRPLERRAEGSASLTVSSDAFVSGFFGDGPAWRLSFDDLAEAPYAAFGAFERRVLHVPGGDVDVHLGPGAFPVPHPELVAWIARCAAAVARFYGGFPVPRVSLVVLPAEGREIGGKTMGNGGAAIVVFVGEGAPRETLDDDWVLPHEFIHLALPSLPAEHAWLEEGLSTYLEPIVRLRAGELSPERMWGELFASLPSGLPAADDAGLDRTHTWGRTYWGGALFCLVADVELRTRTHGARGLEDALRAALRDRGSIAVRGKIQEIFAAGDRATGTTTLTGLYETWRDTPVRVDLPALARQLGIVRTSKGVALSDAAPLAAVRRGIEGRGTATPGSPP